MRGESKKREKKDENEYKDNRKRSERIRKKD